MGFGTGGASSVRWFCLPSDAGVVRCGDPVTSNAGEGPRLRSERDGLNVLKLPISFRGRVAAADMDGFGR